QPLRPALRMVRHRPRPQAAAAAGPPRCGARAARHRGAVDAPALRRAAGGRLPLRPRRPR
nr:hypothetical protein [Tanacetum cinerariifolium]